MRRVHICISKFVHSSKDRCVYWIGHFDAKPLHSIISTKLWDRSQPFSFHKKNVPNLYWMDWFRRIQKEISLKCPKLERFIKISMRAKQFRALPSRQVVDCMLGYIGAKKKLIEKYLIIGNWIDWKFIGWAIWPWILYTSRKNEKSSF